MPHSPATPKRSNVRITIFVVLWVLIMINFIDRAALGISLPYIGHDFHLSDTVKGWLLGSFFWTYLLLQIPGGWLLDRVGPRKIVGGAGTLWGIVQLITGFATGGIFLIVCRFGLGAAEAPMFPAGAKLNAHWLPTKERARGATVIDCAGPFGAAVGGLIVTLLIAVFGGWRAAFVVSGAFTILVSVLYYLYLRDTPEQHKRVNAAELAHIGSGADVSSDSDTARLLPRVRDYAKSRSFWAMWVGRLGWAVVFWGISSWAPSFLVDRLHFDLARLGWGIFFIFGMAVVGELLSGYVTDRFRNKTTRYNRVMRSMFVVSGLGAAIPILALPGTTNGYVALALLGIALFFIMFGGLYWAIPAWLAPKSQVGNVGGVMNVASSAGGGLAPIVMGYAIAAGAGSYAGSFVFLGVAALVYLVCSVLIDFEKPMALAPAADAAQAAMR